MAGHARIQGCVSEAERPPMSIRQLQYFMGLYRVRHFGRAAARCHVSQSTLSMQIAKLEVGLGVALFERDKRRVNPTTAACASAPLVAAVLEGVDRIGANVEDGCADGVRDAAG